MPSLRRRPLALLYHGFGESEGHDDPHSLFVPETQLRAQLATLRTGGWVPLDLDGYLARMDGGTRVGRSFLVTIDDGYVSTLELAAPVLASAGVPALLFVPPALVGGRSAWMPEMPDERLLDADQLRAILDFGIEIGVHGLDHTIMVGLGDAELRRHTVEAADLLADLTGRRARAFAYPEGRFDTRAVRAVEAAGFAVGFAVHHDGGRFAISRVDVNPTDTALTFRIKRMLGYRVLWRAAGRLPVPRRSVVDAVFRARSRLRARR